MQNALLGIAGVFFILGVDELLWRKKVLRGERTRNLAHILVGGFVAFWPFFMSMRTIQIIAALMLVVMLVSRRFHIFQGIHAVKRRTYGELFFPISVGLCAVITQSEYIFMAAVLHLALADGLASYLGGVYGKRSRYRILGQDKTWLGSGIFYLVSLVIMTYTGIVHAELFLYANVWVLALLPVMATLAEALSVYGTDDLVVPLLVVSVLQYLHTMA